MPGRLRSIDRERFLESGYAIWEAFLDSHEQNALKCAVEELVAHRTAGKRSMVVSYPELALLTSHPEMMLLLRELMCGKFAMHHIHAARHDAGLPGVQWHQDYEQIPQINRSHLMVHVFYYPDGLNGTIGDLLILPGSHNSVVAQEALEIFGTEDLPGSMTIEELQPGAAVIVHSALFHARRPKPGGEALPRYFIDISYCQRGPRWPSYPGMDLINAKALEMGAGREGKFNWLYDGSQFFDKEEATKRMLMCKGSALAE